MSRPSALAMLKAHLKTSEPQTTDLTKLTEGAFVSSVRSPFGGSEFFKWAFSMAKALGRLIASARLD